MKEFVDKLMERLEDKVEITWKHDYLGGKKDAFKEAIDIVKELAEEYKQCIKYSCSNCEVYNTEKHYCQKWCDVIKGTVAEIEEDCNNNFCEWGKKSAGGIELVREPHRMKLFHIEEERKFCPYCGKKIKIAPYQPKGE